MSTSNLILDKGENMQRRYATQGILDLGQAESLVSKMIYSVEGISNCFLDEDTQEMVVGLTSQSDFALIDRTFESLLHLEKKHRTFRHRIYKQSNVTNYSNKKLHDDVDIIFAEDGTARRDFAVLLFDILDLYFYKIACRHGALLRQYPAMVSVQTLEKCNYIHSFPQNIHLVSEIPHKLDVLECVKTTDRLEEITRLSKYALSPAICFHCYEELTGSRLSQSLVLTARGLCSRHEATWRLGKHRLNNFSMREIVLFGTDAFVESIRRSCMDEAWQLFESFGLEGRIETASDPFYFSEDTAKGQHQLMANKKYELIVTIGSEVFSIASFNHMGNTLCKPFDICDTNNKFLNSGCIGFGIDRWVYALLKTYGTQLESWPQLFQDKIALIQNTV
ncbi:amino acid--ACP ligase [Cohnella endophytica]|uniref:Amino acid--ACP ligase n=1 Tax=Cohnella endophytica TaxID=2419778 RepID=A0A494Y265_9BACL|nr:amino acid--ACP ligase [Cohnella endophytica]RKP54432.1 amino acid--ACP ligase [Cohnella endophytica]